MTLSKQDEVVGMGLTNTSNMADLHPDIDIPAVSIVIQYILNSTETLIARVILIR